MNVREFLKNANEEILFRYAKEIVDNEKNFSDGFREFAITAYTQTGVNIDKITLLDFVIFSHALLREAVRRGYIYQP